MKEILKNIKTGLSNAFVYKPKKKTKKKIVFECQTCDKYPCGLVKLNNNIPFKKCPAPSHKMSKESQKIHYNKIKENEKTKLARR